MKKFLVAAIALLLSAGAFASNSGISGNQNTAAAVKRVATTNNASTQAVKNAATDDFGFRLVLFTLERMTDRMKNVKTYQDLEEIQNIQEEFAPILTEEQKAYVLTAADKEKLKNVTIEFYKYAVPVALKYSKEIEMTNEEILKLPTDILDSIDKATTFGQFYLED